MSDNFNFQFSGPERSDNLTDIQGNNSFTSPAMSVQQYNQFISPEDTLGTDRYINKQEPSVNTNQVND